MMNSPCTWHYVDGIDSKNDKILWAEIKKTEVQADFFKVSTKSSTPFFVLGTNPWKVYLFIGIDEIWRALVTYEGPGITVT